MTEEERRIEFVRAAATGNRLSCADAHALSERNGITLEEIGRICNALGIRIRDCRLGCF